MAAAKKKAPPSPYPLPQFKLFCNDAARTEPAPDDYTRIRAGLDSHELAAVMVALQTMVLAGEAIDAAKKVVFYRDSKKKAALFGTMERLGQRLVGASDNLRDLQAYGDDFTHELLMARDLFSANPDLIEELHAVMGLAGESGELAENLYLYLRGQREDVDYRRNWREELGDLMWYVPIALRTLKTDLSSILAEVIGKLRVRFPDKFSGAAATARADKK